MVLGIEPLQGKHTLHSVPALILKDPRGWEGDEQWSTRLISMCTRGPESYPHNAGDPQMWSRTHTQRRLSVAATCGTVRHTQMKAGQEPCGEQSREQASQAT